MNHPPNRQRPPSSARKGPRNSTTTRTKVPTIDKNKNKKKKLARTLLYGSTVGLVSLFFMLSFCNIRSNGMVSPNLMDNAQWHQQVKTIFLQGRGGSTRLLRELLLLQNQTATNHTPSRSTLFSNTEETPVSSSFSSTSWWSLKLALDRFDQEAGNRNMPALHHVRRVAVFFQFGTNLPLLPDLMACATNVITAATTQSGGATAATTATLPFELDFYLAFLHGHDDGGTIQTMQRALQQFSVVQKVDVAVLDNAGADVGPFLAQFTNTSSANVDDENDADLEDDRYQAVLKLHTKSDDVWRLRMVESLCGSPEQVLSIWKALDHPLSNKNNDNNNNKNSPQQKTIPQPTLIAPMGTMMGRHFNLSAVFPHVARKYQYHNRTDTQPIGGLPRGVPLFGGYTVKYMNRLYRQLGGKANPVFGGQRRRLYRNREHWIVAGTSFWAHYAALYPHDWKRGRVYETYVSERLTPGYKDNYGMEHAVERLIPSILVQRKGNLWDVQPAPRVLLNYGAMSSLAETTTNDSDKNSALSLSIRRQQGKQVAQQGGVQGFVYSWMCPYQRNMLQQMLQDGEPNLPFVVSINMTKYANDKTSLMESLAPYLGHANYIRVLDRPALVIQCDGSADQHQSTEETLSSQLKQWTESAEQLGLGRPHWIVQQYASRIPGGTERFVALSNSTRAFAKRVGAEASLQQVDSSTDRSNDDDDDKTIEAQPTDLEMVYRLRDLHVQYRGMLEMMSTPDAGRFGRALVSDFQSLSQFSSREVEQALYFVTLESTTTRSGDEEQQRQGPQGSLILQDYLQAIRLALTHIPMKDVKEGSLDAHFVIR